MRGSDNLAAVRIIAQLRAIQADAARIAVVAAETALAGATERTGVQYAARAEALSCWHDALAVRSLDPRYFAIVGNWVVDREKSFKGAELDQAMAERHRGAIARACAEKMALCEVSIALRDRLGRQLDRSNEERRAQVASDFHLITRRTR
jgi:hypothetical protein